MPSMRSLRITPQGRNSSTTTNPSTRSVFVNTDVLAIMFGVVLVEGRRGVWGVQNSVFERTGILVTDELARLAISQCTQGQKRSNKLKEEMSRVKKVDDIAKWFGDGDGLPASSKDHVGLSAIMRALIETCKGRDVSSWRWWWLIRRSPYLIVDTHSTSCRITREHSFKRTISPRTRRSSCTSVKGWMILISIHWKIWTGMRKPRDSRVFVRWRLGIARCSTNTDAR